MTILFNRIGDFAGQPYNYLTMTPYLIVRYIHFIGIILLASSLFAELIVLKPRMTRVEISRLAKIDALYGIASLLVLGGGLTLWFVVGKPSEFYSSNPVFITKLILFGIVGLISIRPTIYFLKNRKGVAEEQLDLPVGLKRSVIIELLVLAIIPLLAVLMAAGIRF